MSAAPDASAHEARLLARQLELERTAARVILDELDTNELAQAVARQAALIVSAESTSVGVVEYDSVIAQAHFGSPAEPLPAQLKPGIALRSISTGQTLIENTPRPGVRNVLCAPVLNHQGAALAFIEARNRRDGSIFRASDARNLESLARLASLGFQRSRLVDRLAEWSRSLEMMLAFSASVNQHLDPGQLIRRLVENAAAFLKADGGMGGLRSQAGTMYSDGVLGRGKWRDGERHWAANEGLAGSVLEQEFPLLSNDYPADKLAEADLLAEVRHALCVPIKDEDSAVIGFFELHRYAAGNPFTWQEASFVESLANVTAVSIRNAQLLKAVELKNAEIQALSAHHVHRLEEERRHISRELHDESGQILIGIKLALQVLAREIPAEHGDLRKDLDDLREQVNQATGRLNDLARWLRPPTLDQLGLEVALRQLATDLQARSGLRIDLDLDPVQPRLPQSREIALYRIVQEAISNVLRHSGATCVSVRLQAEPGRLLLCIRDNGAGFDESQASTARGLGLLGMRERAGMLEGVFSLETELGKGVEIRVEVPRR